MEKDNIPHHLDSYYTDNTPEALDKLIDSGYYIEDGSYPNRDYYMEYPYLLLHEGHIEFCHNRHLNRDDLYGTNKKMELVNGQFFINLG